MKDKKRLAIWFFCACLGLVCAWFLRPYKDALVVKRERCSAWFTLVHQVDDARTITSSGEMVIHLLPNHDTVVHYVGTLAYKNSGQPIRYTQVNRTLEFSNKVRGDVMESVTGRITRSLHDTSDDADVTRYTFDGLAPGVRKVASLHFYPNGVITSGDGPYPRAVCIPE